MRFKTAEIEKAEEEQLAAGGDLLDAWRQKREEIKD